MSAQVLRYLRMAWYIAGVVSFPAIAHANAAMELALTIFEWPMWLAYVAFTVVFEAFAMGRILKIKPWRALATSAKANLLTALLGTLVSLPIWVIIGQYGSLLNPNPFGHTLMLFVVFGILSALLEAGAWKTAAGKGAPVDAVSGEPLVPRPTRQSVLVHLLGVPLGMAILLIPPHPYPGLEGQASWARTKQTGFGVNADPHLLQRAMCDYSVANGHYPKANTSEEALRELAPYLGKSKALSEDYWTAAYMPSYARFDTHEMRREPYLWNPEAGKYSIDNPPEKQIWLLKWRFKPAWGIIMLGSDLKRTNNPEDLGEKPSTAETH